RRGEHVVDVDVHVVAVGRGAGLSRLVARGPGEASIVLRVDPLVERDGLVGSLGVAAGGEGEREENESTVKHLGDLGWGSGSAAPERRDEGKAGHQREVPRENVARGGDRAMEVEGEDTADAGRDPGER